MSGPILLTGGTGTLGRLMLPLLREAGCKVRVLSRSSHEGADGVEFVTGDLEKGTGLDAALTGIEVVVHCAGTQKGDEVKAKNLVEAAKAAGGVKHIVYISVVGADRVPVVSGVDRAMFGYFASKLAGEEIIAKSGIPWTTLRATQFHELTLTTAKAMAKMPVLPVPGKVKFQPVDGGEVAARMVELALGRPAGLVPDLGGPKTYEFKDLVRSYLKAAGKRRMIMSMRLPGKAAKAFREGANLAPDRAVGKRTWEEFLAAEVPAKQ